MPRDYIDARLLQAERSPSGRRLHDSMFDITRSPSHMASTDTTKAGPRRRHARAVRSAVETLATVAVAVALALGIQAFLVKPYRVPSLSMWPTLEKHQRILVDRLEMVAEAAQEAALLAGQHRRRSWVESVMGIVPRRPSQARPT